jgi:hypothetical protein
MFISTDATGEYNGNRENDPVTIVLLTSMQLTRYNAIRPVY